MNQKILQIGKKITPSFALPFVRKCLQKWKNILERKQLKEIQTYYTLHKPDEETKEILEYLPVCGLRPFPYEWAEMDKADSIEVYFDEERGLHYVLLEGKRLYYPADMEEDTIRHSYYFVQMVEQNRQSPHRYLTPEFDVSEDDIVADCGVAEGNFSLSVVEKVKRLYLFEPEERWMKPLEATFAPWAEKVTIVQTYLSDSVDNGENSSDTIDNYFSNKDLPTFVKLDVEGYEEKVLSGAKNSMTSGAIQKVVTCVYHYADDELKLGDLLRSYGYMTKPSSGYMIFSLYDSLQPPYFRRGVLRCVKK